MNTCQFHLSNWQGLGPVWAISINLVCLHRITCLSIPQSLRLNLTYCLKPSPSLVFLFLLVCMVDESQMCPSSISPLALFCFSRSYVILRGSKGGLWSHELLRGPDLKEGGLRPLFIPWPVCRSEYGRWLKLWSLNFPTSFDITWFA